MNLITSVRSFASSWADRVAKKHAIKLGISRSASFTRTQPPRADDSNNLCLVSDRLKFRRSNEELVDFAFACLTSPGHSTVGPDKFISVLREMQLDFNLCDYELRRVFDGLDSNGDGELSLEEFKWAGKVILFQQRLWTY